VIGEAGIGKTRLGAELFRELRSDPDPWRTIVGRSPPYGEGIAFWALGEILRDAADLSTDAPPDEVERSLQRLLSELGADDAPSLAAGLTITIRGRPDCDAEEQLSRSWRRFVSLLASDGPLAIGVDDAHWADEGTLELLEDVAYGLHDAPILVLCTSRPELAERRPEFGRTARNNTQLELLPLDRDATTHLAELSSPVAEPTRPGSRTPQAAIRSSPRRSRAGSAMQAPTARRRSPTPCRPRSQRGSISSRPRRSGHCSTQPSSGTPSPRARWATCSAPTPATRSGHSGAA
jgi:hypothetical protein